MDRIGIAFSGGPSPAEIVECVKLAERLGYESAWVAEGHGGDQFAVLAACATQTSRILLGTAITSVFVRTAPTIAMAAASVDDLSAGRFILGLGSSHKVQVEAEHGVAYTKPLTRVRECVALIRDLLRDGRVRFEGETIRSAGFDLWFTPRRPEIPIYLSAVFPKMTELCGEIADGNHPDAQHRGDGRPGPRAAGRRSEAGGPRPQRDRRHDAAAHGGGRDAGGGARRAAAGARVLCRVLSPLQPHDGRARFCRGGRGSRRGLGARRPEGGRTGGQRRDNRRDQHRRHARRMPRADRSLSAIRHRPADPQPVCPRSRRQGPVRGGDPGLRTGKKLICR
jgi:alkanesulfonate monooxygenase SsuD/methylene tetrahydromethanopterin reductase-like flavin-dependent oxidoreductase (luciferase family)